MLIGANESTAGGHHLAVERAQADSCECMQILTKSPQQWHAPRITPEGAKMFIEALNQSSIRSVVAHAAYLINLASDKKELLHKSMAAMIDERQRAQALGVPFLIFHPGASSSDKACEQVADAMDSIIERTPECDTMLLIENTAGAGTIIGDSFEELKSIYKNLSNKKKVGFCFDSCHAFASGYDLRSKDKYSSIFEQFDKLIGLEKIRCFHLNDSMNELGSHKDRHETIGKGYIGAECFKLLVNDLRFKNVPGCLETHPDIIKGFLPQVKLLKSFRRD